MVRALLAVIGVVALAACSSPGSTPGEPGAAPPTAPTSAAPTVSASVAPTGTSPATAPAGSEKSAVVTATADEPATLTYTENGEEVQEEFSGTWEKTVEVTESPTTLSLTIESDGPAAVGCEIRVDDGTHTRNRSSGTPATVTCSTTIS